MKMAGINPAVILGYPPLTPITMVAQELRQILPDACMIPGAEGRRALGYSVLKNGRAGVPFVEKGGTKTRKKS